MNEIVSKIVDFSNGSVEGPVAHHSGFAEIGDYRAIKMLDNLVDAGIVDGYQRITMEDGKEGYIFHWYSTIPMKKFRIDEVQLNFINTGDGSNRCYECNTEFAPDHPERLLNDGDIVPCHCPQCGKRSATPEAYVDRRKIRRKIEDFLRKNQDSVLSVAHFLGII